MSVAGLDVAGIWDVLDGQVAAGRMPGYAAAVRIGGETAVRTGGHLATGPDSAPVREDTLFRIASIAKPMGGALTLSLVQDGVLGLDDPIARWLPEAANARVLAAPGAPLDQTVAAVRPVTVRHLLAGTSGWGVTAADSPIRAAMQERGVHPGPLPPRLSPDEFAARLTAIPLAFQPGEGWSYDSGVDLLGVLLARAAGKPLSDLMAQRITGPLGMADTSFWTAQTGRLATAYLPGPDGLRVPDPPAGAFAAPPPFEKLSGGLVSTVADVLRFYTAMADDGAPILDPRSTALLTADALTPEQRRQAEPFIGPGTSWGLGTGVDLAAAQPWMSPGRWGWSGGSGTTAYVDPVRDTVSVLLTQRAMTGPDDGFEYFWTAVAGASGR
jgi:CubicO group peptidase (beta-lactamase class C family)